MKRKNYALAMLLLCGLFIAPLAALAQVTVTGKVIDAASGDPLPGVSVVVQGTTIGASTDLDGNYELNAPSESSIIEFSFLGYTSQTATANQSIINIELATDAEALGEVVVTALGIERDKNTLPYSAQTVSGESIAETRGNNFVNALSGKVAGLRIKTTNTMGGSTNVVLRGSKSLTGNNQALFVVDGVPISNSNNNTTTQQGGGGGFDYGNAAADINPDNIASITVLKGAAATALYGSRAANGVIMITTKKGFNGLGIVINSGITVGNYDKSTFAEYQDGYGAGYGQYYASPDGFFDYKDVDGDGQKDLVVPMAEDATHGAPFDPNLMVYGWYSFDPTSPYYMQKRPWVAAENGPASFFKTAFNTSNSIQVRGGTEKTTLKVGYAKNTENGILENSELRKDIINFSATHKMTSKLTASASVNTSFIKGKGRYGTGYDSRNLMTNFRQWWQNNVDVQQQREAYFRNRQNISWNPTATGAYQNPIFWDNPYWSRYENYETDNRVRSIGYVNLDYKLADWVSLVGRVSVDTYNESYDERIAVGGVDVSDYQRFDRKFREYNYNLMANFNTQLSSNFKLSGLIGTNIRKNNIGSVFASTNGGLIVPRLYSLLNSANPILAPVETDVVTRVDGYFAAATLNYKDMLILDLTNRVDRSSTLPEKNNTYMYPSASFGFVFSELIENSPWLTLGKFRANYAEVGNDAPALSVKDVYFKPPSFGSVPLFSVSGIKNNPELKSERTKSYELGLEMAFMDRRLGFDVTYYNLKSVDQIVPVTISTATGYNAKFVNAGIVENNGIEVALYVTPVQTSDFSWTVNANWSKNQSEVVELPEGIDNLPLGSFQGGISITAAEGQPYGTIRGTDFIYDDNGNRVVDANGLYKQSATSNEVIGNINPDWTGGLSNTLTYKGLSLSFLLDFRQGGDVFSLDHYYGLATGIYPETAGLNDLGNPVRSPIADGGGVILPGVTETGEVNQKRISAVNFGVFGYRRNPAAEFIYDASYIKLREASLSYSLPQSVINKIDPIKGVELSLIGRNLWIIHKNIPYSDPEAGLGAGNVQGYLSGAYPTVRTFGFNLKLRF